MSSFAKKWDDFYDKAIGILAEDPIKTRITMKYRHSQNVAILKVTDDKKICQIKLSEENDYKKLEAFFDTSLKILANVTEGMQEEKREKAGRSKKAKTIRS
eukprot:TRINITY_DN11553_c0_g1_i2.p1 TRINITY_DN11553_c0_g1~~TRINITY_DN11553_c0_g1_i2.p1  ORF type:complete len:101 (+),score=33.84 TRINITY_DN11553_c0_g1_i2:138-440(+)